MNFFLKVKKNLEKIEIFLIISKIIFKEKIIVRGILMESH